MTTSTKRLHPLGTHRVLEPEGAMPQAALRVDNTPVCYANEILCDVETLNIDSASFKQISDAENGDAERIAAHITQIISQRGKQHNPVTGSGGMFIGRVREIGATLAENIALQPGDRIWVHADLPESQSARFVLVVSFFARRHQPSTP